MDESALNAKEFALNERNETGNNENPTTDLHEDGDKKDRRFGVQDMWGIRRGARAFKIHGRVPRI